MAINPILMQILIELRILTNLGLEAIKGEMFMETPVVKNIHIKLVSLLATPNLM